MTRPLALTGFTLFLVLAFLCDKDIKTAVILLVVLAAAFAGSLAVKKVRQTGVFPASFATGIVACILFIAAMELEYLPATAYSGRTCNITAVLTDGEYLKNGRYYCQAKAVSIDGVESDVNIRLSSKLSCGLEPYDTIRGDFTLYTIGGDDSELVGLNRANGVYLGGYSMQEVTCESVPSEQKPFGYRLWKIREAVKDSVYDIFPNEAGALIIALLIGDTAGLSAATLSAFRCVGVSHIISVSGMHLSVWALFLLKFSGRSRRRKVIFASLSMLFVAAFTALTGFSYSVLRAAIMSVIMLTGVIVSREKDSINSLGAAALAILAFRPFAAGDISFQLSFLSTLGIILGFRQYAFKLGRLTQKIKQPVASRVVRYALLSVLTTVSAIVFTLPVTMRVWHSLNLISIAANLMIILAATVCMVSGGITVLVSFLPLIGGLSALPACVAGICSKYIIHITDVLSHGDLLTLWFEKDIAAVWLAGALMLVAVGVIVSFNGKRVTGLTAALCAVSFAVMVAVSAVESSVVQIVAADVGNGTAVMVKSGSECALIGCGGDKYNSSGSIISMINNSNATSLDLMIIPRTKDTESSCAVDVLLELTPSMLAYNELPYGAELLAPRSKNVSAANTEFVIDNDVKIKSVSGGNSCYAVVYVNRSKVLVSMYPGGYIEPEDRAANALICRSDVPGCLEVRNYELVVLTGADKAFAVQQRLNSQGINACATAGNGNVIIRTAGDGDIAAYREN